MLGPLWVWLALSERPSTASLVGEESSSPRLSYRRAGNEEESSAHERQVQNCSGVSGTELRLVLALRSLVSLQRFRRVDLAETGVGRDKRLRELHPELLGQHGAERGHLHLPEAGKRADPLLEVGRVGRLVRDAGGVSVVVLDHDRRELADALGHRAGEAVDCRNRPEGRLQVEIRQLARVECPDALLEGDGPANAFGTGTCWSIANSTSRANGSSASSLHAAGSSVKYRAFGMARCYSRRGSRQPATDR